MNPASCKVKVTFFENWKEPESGAASHHKMRVFPKSEAASHHKMRVFPKVYAAMRPDLFTCKEDLVKQSCWLAGLLIVFNVKLRATIIATWCTLRQVLSKTCKHFSQSIILLTIFILLKINLDCKFISFVLACYIKVLHVELHNY